MTREEVAKNTTFSLSKVDALIASGELPAAKIGRRVVIQPRHVRELLEKNMTNNMVPNRGDNSEVADVIADEAKHYIRCQMGHDPVGWAQVVNDSRYPIKMHFAAMCNVIACMAGEVDDPEHFLEVVAEIIRRD